MAGAGGIVAAASVEIGSVGVGTAVAAGVAFVAVPTLGQGVSNIIAGAVSTGNTEQIPPATLSYLAPLAATGNTNIAQGIDTGTSLIMYGANAVTMSTGVEMVATGLDGINIMTGFLNQPRPGSPLSPSPCH